MDFSIVFLTSFEYNLYPNLTLIVEAKFSLSFIEALCSYNLRGECRDGIAPGSMNAVAIALSQI